MSLRQFGPKKRPAAMVSSGMEDPCVGSEPDRDDLSDADPDLAVGRVEAVIDPRRGREVEFERDRRRNLKGEVHVSTYAHLG